MKCYIKYYIKYYMKYYIKYLIKCYIKYDIILYFGPSCSIWISGRGTAADTLPGLSRTAQHGGGKAPYIKQKAWLAPCHETKSKTQADTPQRDIYIYIHRYTRIWAASTSKSEAVNKPTALGQRRQPRSPADPLETPNPLDHPRWTSQRRCCLILTGVGPKKEARQQKHGMPGEMRQELAGIV